MTESNLVEVIRTWLDAQQGLDLTPAERGEIEAMVSVAAMANDYTPLELALWCMDHGLVRMPGGELHLYYLGQESLN